MHIMHNPLNEYVSFLSNSRLLVLFITCDMLGTVDEFFLLKLILNCPNPLFCSYLSPCIYS